jgi:flagellar hook-associated protein 2
MSDVFIPGVRSRFGSEQAIEGLMSLERIPRDRTQANIDNLQVQRSYWQELGRRITSLRDSSRFLFSFQNPFNERITNSSDSSALTASATREASVQSFSFSVRQTAQADRFLSRPLDERTRIEAGNYVFSVGSEEISIDFRGGTLRDFVDAVNRRGRDRIGASLIAVQSGTRSLLIESRVTGAENRLGFHGDAVELAMNLGIAERTNDTQRNISINNEVLNTAPRSTSVIPLNLTLTADSPLILRLETRTRVETGSAFISTPPPGPTIPAGSVTHGGITIENDPSIVPLQTQQPPSAPVRNDDMSVLTLVFSDGTTARLPAISDSGTFTTRQYNLAEIAGGRTIVSLNVENSNTHREVSINNIEILDPTARSGNLGPLNAVSTARDAIITMEGIEITRSTNNIDDLVPGVTLNVRGVSDRPVEISVVANIEAVKDAIISFVGNYNRLMAEINVLTAPVRSAGLNTPANRDDRVITELTYLTADEAAAMRERLGVFSGDSSLTSLRNNLRRTVSAPYPTSMERELSLLAQIGISTNASGTTGYDASRMRGYLEINERVLDAALENNLPAVRELFAFDTTGDLLADTGIAFNVDALVRPFVETGGIISIKTNTIESRITQDERRIANLDRQLAARETELRMQYARMEAAFERMERMSSSLENFGQQNWNR